nr:hypothetical protein [Streptomyces sp. CB01883]
MAYRREHGHEAFEQLFDEHAIGPTDPSVPQRCGPERNISRVRYASHAPV